MAMSTEKTLVVNAMCNTHKFLSLGNNTHSCISHTIHKYNNYVITLVCVAARVTPTLVDDHCYITPSSSFLRPRKTSSLLTHNLHNVEGVDDFFFWHPIGDFPHLPHDLHSPKLYPQLE